MIKLNYSLLLALLFLIVSGCNKEPVSPETFTKSDSEIEQRSPTIVQETPVIFFMPAGDLGGPDNVLEPGTPYPPTKGASATLKRTSNYLQFNIHTTGLPPGGYTVWWVIFNDPGTCTAPGPGGNLCGEADLGASYNGVVWATGKVVKDNGVGNFSNRLYVGEERTPGTQQIIVGDMISSPLANPMEAEVHLIIKYHGPASEDPEVLNDQINTFLGSCGPDEGANSFYAGPVFGYQCFDPQAAIFLAP